MPDPDRTQIHTALEEVCAAVGADGGALYLGDGDGVLHLAAAAAAGAVSCSGCAAGRRNPTKRPSS